MIKIKDVAVKFDLDRVDFEEFIRKSKLSFYDKITGMAVDDDVVDSYVDAFKAHLQQMLDKEIAEEEEEKKKQRALARMLISSGFSFDGYRIVKYSGYISGDDAVEIPRGRGKLFNHENHGENLTDALVKIRRQALLELKEAAYNLGCNAVIGVDFDYITLEPETANMSGGTTYEPYVICVTANGNAVVIEKEDRS